MTRWRVQAPIGSVMPTAITIEVVGRLLDRCLVPGRLAGREGVEPSPWWISGAALLLRRAGIGRLPLCRGLWRVGVSAFGRFRCDRTAREGRGAAAVRSSVQPGGYVSARCLSPSIILRVMAKCSGSAIR
jgi:hypothetical protein